MKLGLIYIAAAWKWTTLPVVYKVKGLFLWTSVTCLSRGTDKLLMNHKTRISVCLYFIAHLEKGSSNLLCTRQVCCILNKQQTPLCVAALHSGFRALQTDYLQVNPLMWSHGEVDVNKMEIIRVQQLDVVMRCSEEKRKQRIKLVWTPFCLVPSFQVATNPSNPLNQPLFRT